MLSYNTSVAVNGQRPSSSGTMSSGRQSIPPSPRGARFPSPLSNGVMANGATPSNGSPATQQHIWLVTGPAGCGKSTVAKHIADVLRVPFIEGDEVRCLTPSVCLSQAARRIILTLTNSTTPSPTSTR